MYLTRRNSPYISSNNYPFNTINLGIELSLVKSSSIIKMGFTSYSGPVDNFPAITTWATFETIFNNNKTAMESTGDSGPDIGCIWNAVNSAAASIGVDQRVIFCIIMQESTGNVGVGTTNDQDGTATGGLMQCSSSPAFPGQHNLTQVCVNFRG
jgi:hypothetical protein